MISWVWRFSRLAFLIQIDYKITLCTCIVNLLASLRINTRVEAPHTWHTSIPAPNNEDKTKIKSKYVSARWRKWYGFVTRSCCGTSVKSSRTYQVKSTLRYASTICRKFPLTRTLHFRENDNSVVALVTYIWVFSNRHKNEHRRGRQHHANANAASSIEVKSVYPQYRFGTARARLNEYARFAFVACGWL